MLRRSTEVAYSVRDTLNKAVMVWIVYCRSGNGGGENCLLPVIVSAHPPLFRPRGGRYGLGTAQGRPVRICPRPRSAAK